MVNIAYIDHRGDHFAVSIVEVIWPGEPKPDKGAFCTIPGLTYDPAKFPIEEGLTISEGFDVEIRRG